MRSSSLFSPQLLAIIAIAVNAVYIDTAAAAPKARPRPSTCTSGYVWDGNICYDKPCWTEGNDFMAPGTEKWVNGRLWLCDGSTGEWLVIRKGSAGARPADKPPVLIRELNP